MSIILAEWVPKKIINLPTEQAGAKITGDRWRELWQLTIEQGDYNSDTLALLLSNYFEFKADTEDALAHRRSTDIALDHTNPLDIANTDQADCHPIAAITGLQAMLDAITAGAVSAFDHNDIGDRDVADCHPTSAITGLDAALGNLVTGLSTLTSSNIAHAGSNVATKLASIDATIAALSGNMSEIAHNDLASRDASDAHSMAAITGLVTALAGKQKTITSGTAAPSGGSDGDIYIRYA